MNNCNHISLKTSTYRNTDTLNEALSMLTRCYFSQVSNDMMLCFTYSAVRVTVYRTIELWVRVGGASLLQGSPTHTELLFTHLMGDITPASEAVKVGLRVFVTQTS